MFCDKRQLEVRANTHNFGSLWARFLIKAEFQRMDGKEVLLRTQCRCRTVGRRWELEKRRVLQ